ncbi:MAG: HAD hydrolase-like protein [Euryarchaeota archaeon]|nr:HAD hydrolase-like protein [Euryarchaeota archaeon]MBV1728912.1 HAD hydrolase-like protein [Methanobacterium sp.]MBU4547695.1 HAD hydrolase-like protein [Euryarchaeota archaeon]MBU4608232.1 HAD hydrolase-like protein [Euryarchaeota archaeon]MBV1755251.1 HAD hydrolase-like protein [Methanobacterium sp.]
MILLLFDIDKTLIDRSECHHRAFRHAFHEVFEKDADIDIINYHGKTDPQIACEVLKKEGLAENFIKKKLEEFKEVLSSYFILNVKYDHIVVLDGVRDLIVELESQGMLLGLITGNLESIARAKLKHVGLDKYFKLGGFGSDNYHRPYLVSTAIKRASLEYDFRGNNSHVFVIGDTPWDIKAGMENKTRTIGVSTGIYSPRELKDAGADFVLDSLKYKKEFMGFLKSR